MSEDIARAELDVVWPDGRRARATIALGRPYHDAKWRAWRCPVRLEGLVPPLQDIAGYDSLQALLLALRIAHQELARVEASGARLLSVGEQADDPDSRFDLKVYFGGLGTGSSSA